ncbi:MAG: hypothetical protein M1839_005335 [Geoglossum umbratile]|nr:MAG: hypothetical protein M1839_005335 [Geoglossum umbratile]
MRGFGDFGDFCRVSTLPVCNLFESTEVGCRLSGIPLNGGPKQLGNLGVIILCAVSIVVSGFLIWTSEKKEAAVGRREMQLLLGCYILVEICEIFSVGGLPLDRKIIVGFTGVHLAAITAAFWILLLNAAVGYQLLNDGTPLSLGLIGGSAALLFVGTGYIALDTGFRWTGHFDNSLKSPNNNIGLYVLYQLLPLVFASIFFILETFLVWSMLDERRPMLYLGGAALLFAIGQIFNYVISTHICQAANGKIDGSLFETLFTLLAVITLWAFWSSITEDEWPASVVPMGPNYPGYTKPPRTSVVGHNDPYPEPARATEMSGPSYESYRETNRAPATSSPSYDPYADNARAV